MAVSHRQFLVCLSLTPLITTIVGSESSRGKTAKLPNGVELHGDQFQEGGTTVYYGIKYGTAGRFEHAKPNTDFSYLKDVNRVKQGHVCPHIPLAIPGFPARKLNMSEDCLYLDVYVPPSNKEESAGRPVFFWIYGGAFKVGDKDMYNATILARAIDAIVVTVNYRVSAFGFLGTGDDAARGNWAIGDLKLALNWTIGNIAAFGGDPTKMTLSGESAGGVLTSALLLDDNVRSKVNAAIAFSGSILSRWAITKKPEVVTLALAGHLGCPNWTSIEAVACLKGLPFEVLLNGTSALESLRERNNLEVQYTPVVDGLHIPKTPEEILRDRTAKSSKSLHDKRATVITGYLREDVSLMTLMAAPHVFADNATHNYSSTLNMLGMFTIGLTGGRCPPEEAAIKARAAFDFYKVPQNLSTDEALRLYHQIASDMMFGVYTMKESMMYANISHENNQMFLISFDPGYRRLGAFHGMDVFHLFRGYFDAFLKEKTSDRVSKTLHDYVRQIAYTGRYEGPYFGQEGNYHDLAQSGEIVDKRTDFSTKVALLNDILSCGSD